MLIRICMTCHKFLGLKGHKLLYKTLTAPIALTHGLCDYCYCNVINHEIIKRRLLWSIRNMTSRDMIFHFIQNIIRRGRGIQI